MEPTSVRTISSTTSPVVSCTSTGASVIHITMSSGSAAPTYAKAIV